MSQTVAPRVSILGDSISTFEGYTPPVGVFYTRNYISYSGFSTAEETWWMQVISQLGGKLLANNSFQGTFLSYGGLYPAVLSGRIRSLGTDEDEPDLILIYTGLNDIANHIPLADFKRDCLELLTKAKNFHPQSEIWYGTLCEGLPPSDDRPYFIEPEQLKNREDYNNVIRDCVSQTGCQLADLAAQGVTYATMDGVHPNKEGMTTFAQAWVRNLKAKH